MKSEQKVDFMPLACLGENNAVVVLKGRCRKPQTTVLFLKGIFYQNLLGISFRKGKEKLPLLKDLFEVGGKTQKQNKTKVV